MEESKGEDDSLCEAITSFMAGNTKRRRVKEVLERRLTDATPVRVTLEGSRSQWRRLRRLHDAPFGQALFMNLTVARTSEKPWSCARTLCWLLMVCLAQSQGAFHS